MRPIKLKMQAFGSYINPVFLDFESNLRGERIFLIHGVTGAGKTTILDAICFALYGTASGDEREGAMMRSKGVSDKVKTEVEFRFALGNKIYTAYRTLIGKGDKISQTAELCCGEQVLETKSTAVTKKIKELLGFDVKQFRQVVLLPQGEFKKFLFAKADDRQPVLDALFNAEFYRRIVEGLEKKFKAFKDEYEKLLANREMLATQLQGAAFDNDAIEQLRADLDAARDKVVELKNVFDKTQRELTAGEILARDFAELERRKKSLDAAKNNLAQAEKIFIELKAEYDLREGEQTRRETLKSEIDSLTKIEKAFAELDNKRKEFAAAEKIFQTAEAALKKFADNDKKYKARLEQLKQQRETLAGAEKNFAEAKITFDRACEREKILQEISRLEKDSAMLAKKIVRAEKIFNEAQLKVNRLRELQIKGSAARLASQLKDGEACPVCGSKVHPELALSEEIIPSNAEIDAAQVQADKCKKNLDDARQSASAIDGQITTQKNHLQKYAEVPATEEAKKFFDAAQKAVADLEDCQRRIKKGDDCIKKNDADLELARDRQKAADGVKNQRFGEVQATENQIPKNYLDNRQSLESDIGARQKTLRELEAAWKRADKNYHDADNKKSSCETTFKLASDAQKELADKLSDKNPPALTELKARAEESQRNYLEAVKAETSLKNSLDNLKRISVQIYELDKKIVAAEKNLRIWEKLSDAASGKTPGKKISFVRYYLRAMFAQVLTEANYNLAKMSERRYYLKQKDAGERSNSTAGLNMEIFDEYAGETRPVATLSGGESFLASLSLALGLAAVVRNNLGGLKLDTIFIDEGFGSLDSETLDFAMKTLTELQSGGRLVGIISHVEELKNQIPVRLEVSKTKVGSTAGFVVTR